MNVEVKVKVKKGLEATILATWSNSALRHFTDLVPKETNSDSTLSQNTCTNDKLCVKQWILAQTTSMLLVLLPFHDSARCVIEY